MNDEFYRIFNKNAFSMRNLINLFILSVKSFCQSPFFLSNVNLIPHLAFHRTNLFRSASGTNSACGALISRTSLSFLLRLNNSSSSICSLLKRRTLSRGRTCRARMPGSWSKMRGSRCWIAGIGFSWRGRRSCWSCWLDLGRRWWWWRRIRWRNDRSLYSYLVSYDRCTRGRSYMSEGEGPGQSEAAHVTADQSKCRLIRYDRA